MNDSDVGKLVARLAEQQNELLEQQKQWLAEHNDLKRQQAQLQESLHDAQRRTHKDGWDRLSAVAPILSAALIACIGAYFTWSYNLQQLKVQEIQTIERFIPHLTGNERSKRAAILAISSLGNAQLAGKVASIFASEGTVSALKSIAQVSEPKDRTALSSALAKTLDNLADKYRYENKYDEAVAAYKQALAIKEASLGKDNPELAGNLDKLAQLYQSHGDHALAVELSRRAAALKKNAPAGDQSFSAIAGEPEGGNSAGLPPQAGAQKDGQGSGQGLGLEPSSADSAFDSQAVTGIADGGSPAPPARAQDAARSPHSSALSDSEKHNDLLPWSPH